MFGLRRGNGRRGGIFVKREVRPSNFPSTVLPIKISNSVMESSELAHDPDKGVANWYKQSNIKERWRSELKLCIYSVQAVIFSPHFFPSMHIIGPNILQKASRNGSQSLVHEHIQFRAGYFGNKAYISLWNNLHKRYSTCLLNIFVTYVCI